MLFVAHYALFKSHKSQKETHNLVSANALHDKRVFFIFFDGASNLTKPDENKCEFNKFY